MHTPGLWEVNNNLDLEINSCGYPWSAIAHVEPANCLGSREVSKEESIDNARLIAAAPELLEACKLRIEDHQCAQRCDGPHQDCPCWYCRTCAAIASAEVK